MDLVSELFIYLLFVLGSLNFVQGNTWVLIDHLFSLDIFRYMY